MDEQGLLTYYSLENLSPKGLKPVQKLVRKGQAYYEERQVGVQRMYAALGANRRIDSLVRCFNTEINEGMVVTFDDQAQYQVDAMQKVIGKDAIDLTLVRMEKTYEIYAEPTI
jgi:hypothetical protein